MTVYGLSRKIRDADPLTVPPVDAVLSERAASDLEALVPQPGPPRYTRRRGLTLAGAAAVAAVAVAAGVAGTVNRPDGDPPPPPAGNQPLFANAEALEGASDLIVRAKVRDLTPQDDAGVPETVAMVEISHVAKGATRPGDLLAVAYTTPGPDVAEAPAGFTVGREYVFLLTSPDAAKQAHLVGTFQGWYAVQGRRATAADPNRVVLSPAVLAKLELQ